jgi:phosphatidylethanolamine/phosphatidyl-N-methylethanolamine N-methyltransferase
LENSWASGVFFNPSWLYHAFALKSQGLKGWKKMDNTSVLSSYKFFARFYVFGLNPGRSVAVRKMDLKSGHQVLEIGIGTGMSLPLYPSNVEITGIDLTAEMLEQARQRVDQLELDNVRLHLMDAQKLEFPNDSFDKSIAMFVASVTPDPVAMISEMKRVTRPGGSILILNHFSQKGSVSSVIEGALSPLAPLLGFEPLFYQQEFLDKTGMRGAEDIPIQPFGYWRLLCFKNKK